VYAPDLPGYGESDPPVEQSDLNRLVAGVNALADFLDSMRIRSVDLLARGDGAEIAQALASNAVPAPAGGGADRTEAAALTCRKGRASLGGRSRHNRCRFGGLTGLRLDSSHGCKQPSRSQHGCGSGGYR
jgi:hypothetical protein